MAVSSDIYASEELRWPSEISNLEQKQEIADRAAARACAGQLIGIGSGSGAYLVLLAIGRRATREGLPISVLTSSFETETAARRLDLPVVPLGSAEPDWGVDGADEVDPARRLLKGRGGALFREKILWSTAKRMYLAVDASKHVDRLGAGFPLPVEVHPLAVQLGIRALRDAGATDCEIRLATGKDGPVFSENGNLIVDATFNEIPFGLHAVLKAVPGVIETGLFEGYAFELL